MLTSGHVFSGCGGDSLGAQMTECFNPVAGIRKVSSSSTFVISLGMTECFNPVAGIRKVSSKSAGRFKENLGK